MASEVRDDHKSLVFVYVTADNGTRVKFANWTSISFNRSVGGVVGSMTLTCVYDPRIKWQRLVERPASVQLVFDATTGSAIHSVPMMTGYIKGAKMVHKADGPTVTLTIKDKTIDLVECNPITSHPIADYVDGPSPEWIKLFNPAFITKPTFEGSLANINTICKALALPVGITVVKEGQWSDVLEGGVYNVSEEETIFNQIAKLCKEKACVPHTDGYGRLVLGQFAYYYRLPAPYSSNPYDVERNELVRQHFEQESVLGNPGEAWNDLDESDVLELEHEADFTDRFSNYKVIYNPSGDPGDVATTETYRWSGDPRYRGRFRPKVLRPTVAYKGDHQKFADYIRQTQRGGSNTIKVQLRYWYKIHNTATGRRARIYDVGDIVNLKLSKWGYVGEMVIDAVDYSLTGASHRKLTLTLKPKDTYAPPPLDNVYYDWLDGIGDDGSGNPTGDTSFIGSGVPFLSEHQQGIYQDRVNNTDSAVLVNAPEEPLSQSAFANERKSAWGNQE